MSDEQEFEARLQLLLAKRGQELVRGLVEEVTSLHHEIAALRRELGALADYQSMRDRWLSIDGATTRTARMPQTVVVEPDQLLRPRDGFYSMEYTNDGTPFRWTGPTAQFSFDIFIDRAHGAHLRLEALSCIDFEAQKSVMLLVDGAVVPSELVPAGNGFDITAELPARGETRSTNLVFVLPAVLPPEGAAGGDNRLLGLAFGRLTVAANSAERTGG